jgi:predicted ferric reductase
MLKPIAFPPGVLRPLALTGAAALVLSALALAWPAVRGTFAGDAPKVFWMLSRATGLVAFVLAWAGVMLGLSMTSKLARAWPGGPAAYDLHRFCTQASLACAVLHTLLLLGDRYIAPSLLQLLLPFGFEGYEPVWVGLGQLGLYASALLVASFYLRGWLTQRGWRLLHYTSFAVFFGVLLHALFSGTDSTLPVVQAGYAAAALSVLMLTWRRVRQRATHAAV